MSVFHRSAGTANKMGFMEQQKRAKREICRGARGGGGRVERVENVSDGDGVRIGEHRLNCMHDGVEPPYRMTSRRPT